MTFQGNVFNSPFLPRPHSQLSCFVSHCLLVVLTPFPSHCLSPGHSVAPAMCPDPRFLPHSVAAPTVQCHSSARSPPCLPSIRSQVPSPQSGVQWCFSRTWSPGKFSSSTKQFPESHLSPAVTRTVFPSWSALPRSA